MSLRFDRSNEKKPSPTRKKRGRGLNFYAAVLLCLGAAALSYITNRDKPVPQREDTSLTLPTDFELPPVVDEMALDVPEAQDTAVSLADAGTPTAVTTATAAPSRLNITQATQPEETVEASAPLRFRMPTDGKIVSGYSGDELVFCSTMGDWRIHNGIDITGKAGEEVRACTGGIVEDFAADMLYGNTAIIRLPDDSIMYYCGLSDTRMVSKGLQVNAGDVIGYIGEVPCELEDEPHIHLAMIKDGQFVDPAPLLG